LPWGDPLAGLLVTAFICHVGYEVTKDVVHRLASKLHVTALALTLARAWREVLSNAVDPGWVPTKMGGPYATGDLEMGYLTQTWLAVSNDAAATVSGGYWYHRQQQAPAPKARDPAFQDQLMGRLAALTGVALF
jgi:NAD(P)-dependent dehydrogenase (short-subunit alcohol dehydrogenase family)